MADPKYNIIKLFQAIGIATVVSAAVTVGAYGEQVKENTREIEVAKQELRELDKRLDKMQRVLDRIDQRILYLFREELKDSQAGEEE